jgi:hypothetical protein
MTSLRHWRTEEPCFEPRRPKAPTLVPQPIQLCTQKVTLAHSHGVIPPDMKPSSHLHSMLR